MDWRGFPGNLRVKMSKSSKSSNSNSCLVPEEDIDFRLLRFCFFFVINTGVFNTCSREQLSNPTLDKDTTKIFSLMAASTETPKFDVKLCIKDPRDYFEKNKNLEFVETPVALAPLMIMPFGDDGEWISRNTEISIKGGYVGGLARDEGPLYFKFKMVGIDKCPISNNPIPKDYQDPATQIPE